MVCTRNDLSEWKDFPKGLKVLLLDEDSNSASEIKSKLESMDYIVYTFCNEKEAVSAISSGLENFHVAIVEVTNELLSLTAMLESVDEFLEACVIKPSAMIVSTNGNDGGFKFLEAAKDLPTIMTSNIHCISTMMKCIALGAVEFLRKPLSEDKLRNIWQHVVHKAFSAGENDLSESLKPVKHSVASMLSEDEKHKHDDSDKIEDESVIHENDHEPSAASNKYPAPSTPQLEQGGRVLVNGDCHTNCSAEKESGELDGEYKSVETTSGNVIAEGTAPVGEHQGPMEAIEKKEEADLVDGPKGEHMIDSHPQDRVDGKDSDAGAEKPNTVSGLPSSYPNKANRKKMKVDWTTELHKKFVQAVDQLGIDQAIPSRILELMKVEGLTRHNVASHLQKYRMHRRHILPKEAHDRKWPRIDQAQRSFYPHKPIMAFPPYHSNHVVPVGRVYPMWGAPHAASIQTWGSQGYYPWQPTEPWHWKPYPGMHADAWGCPVMPVPQGNCSPFPQVNGFQCSGTMDNKSGMPQNCVEHQPAEDVIDEVVKEAINKPWLPLPLGLKPPSTDSVLAELSRQGISTIPPHNQRL